MPTMTLKEELTALEKSYVDRDCRAHTLAAVSTMVGDFLYYDRDDDEDLPHGAIEAAIEAGELTADEIVEAFRIELLKGLKQ